jgi:aconitate hydratase
VVPPGFGIVHQVNLEYLARGVHKTADGVYYPDTLVGTDSHTTMINGIGVVGWGVGGIEAEAAMLGQPVYFLTPDVVGFELTGRLREGCTATDLVLTVTEILRRTRWWASSSNFLARARARWRCPTAPPLPTWRPNTAPPWASSPSTKRRSTTSRARAAPRPRSRPSRPTSARRACLACPRRATSTIRRSSRWTWARTPSLAGPKRPQDRIELGKVAQQFTSAVQQAGGRQRLQPGSRSAAHTPPGAPVGRTPDLTRPPEGAPRAEARWKATSPSWRPRSPSVGAGHSKGITIGNGDVLIAAITSCTNTSNPSVLLAAGLLAKKAVEAGLKVQPHIKTSLAPGSRIVTEYLTQTGLLPYLEKLGFALAGYGCTTCIGNAGDLTPELNEAITQNDLVCAAVLSGNRNFEARIHPNLKANFLASPPLVVAYAIAGTVL